MTKSNKNMSVIENKRTFQRMVDLFNNTRNADTFVDQLYDKNSVYHGIGEESEVSREEFKTLVKRMVRAFPDISIHIDDLVAENDKVAYKLTIEGTHKGELQDIPPTGRRISFSSVGIMRFKDGKVVEDWEVYDIMGILRQVGALPT